MEINSLTMYHSTSYMEGLLERCEAYLLPMLRSSLTLHGKGAL